VTTAQRSLRRLPIQEQFDQNIRKTFGDRINRGLEVKSYIILPEGVHSILHSAKWMVEGSIMKHLVLRFWRDQSGATAIEYGLIAAGISLAIIAVVNGLGSNLSSKFDSINSSLK
jgi:pilus assembly protein Flp/PilA